MEQYRIIVLQPGGQSDTAEKLAQDFSAKFVTNNQDCLALAAGEEFKVLVVDVLHCPKCKARDFADLFDDEAIEHLPVILLSASTDLKDKLAAFELGFDDVLDANVSPQEASARVNKSIFHCIANEQLKSRLRAANETAYSAMSDNSDLGSNLQFLVEENNCNNFDELGQLLFSTIDHYQLSCSLQMRSVFGTKNMDANGMAKDLESQLLEQLQHAGRFVDFGCRTVINFGQVSLLIRNMPMADPKRYGSIKDNFPALLQGLDARIKALDARNQLLQEKEALQKLSSNVRDVMAEIDLSYQKVMRDIATVVEDLAEAIHARIPVLALSQDQEHFFEEVVATCIADTSRVFNEGLKVDQCFRSLRENMDHALCNIAVVEDAAVDNSPPKPQSSGGGVELF